MAVAEMMEAIRPQFLVWIDDLHRPGDVELTSVAPPGLRLVGAPVEPPRIAGDPPDAAAARQRLR